MLFLLLAAISVAISVFQVRRRYTSDPARIRPALILGGAVYLAGWLIQIGIWQAARSPFTGGISPTKLLILQSFLLGGLAIILWIALSRLLLYRFETRDLVRLLPFGLFSILLGSIQSIFPLTAALLALPALLRLRWRREIGPETLALTSLFGALFVLLNFAGYRLQAETELKDPILLGLQRYSDWVRSLAVLHVVVALPRLLWGMNLPIRSVKRRLLVSHLLTGIVPLVLVGTFWGLSTYLSVNGERAQIAARHLTESGEELGAKLDAALRAPDPAARMREWGDMESVSCPGLSLWIAQRGPASEGAASVPGRLVRLLGDPIPGEEALQAWPDSVSADGVVLLSGRAYLGAIRRSPGLRRGRPEAAILIPMSSILSARLERRIDARTYLQIRWSTPAGELRGMRSGPDSAEAVSAAHTLPGGGTSAGASVVPAMEWLDGSWHSRMVLLWARVGFFHAVRGLALNLSENPFNLIPLVFLGVVAVLFVLVEIVTLGMVASMGSSILRSLAALRQGTARLRSGNLRYRIPIEGNDDLWAVAESFNDMTADLEKARELEIEKERMEGELELARQIQARLLPAEPPVLARTELAGHSAPARQVGGDYFDFLPMDNDRVGLIVADVSGKGVPAALLMSSFRAALHSQDLEDGPAHTFSHLNTFLFRSVEPGRFVTAFLAIFDTNTGCLTYSNAGHNPPYIIRSSGEMPLLHEGGLVLGLFEKTHYEQAEVHLQPGDLLALFTDGVTEATNEDEDFWGEERLAELLRAHRNDPCRRILRLILEEVRNFSGDQGQSDDITLVLARWRGAGGQVGARAGEEAERTTVQVS